MGSLDLRQVTPRCGAEIRGLDLSQSLNDSTAEALRSALAEHCVLFFRDQELTYEQQKAIGSHFGTLHVHPAWPRIVAGHREIMEILAD